MRCKHHPHRQPSLSGFAVTGTGKDALKEAYQVLAKQDKVTDTFSSNSDISIVFFSHQSGRHIVLAHVERDGNTFRLTYQTITHPEAFASQYFALIPVGKLEAGKYNVEINQLPPKHGDPFTDEEMNSIICKPFSFTVTEK